MPISCEIIPKKRGSNQESTLFRELLDITGNNREVVKELWGVYNDTELMKSKGIPTDTEPSAVEFLSKTGLAETALNSEGYAEYVTESEGLDDSTYKTWSDATSQISRLSQKYPTTAFVASESPDGYTIKAVANTRENVAEQTRQQNLGLLNDRLIAYMRQLGFGVDTITGLGAPGKFSPLSAEKNADNLISIIKLSKGITGQLALAEEFSHFILEGTKSSPLTTRLINALMANDDAVRNILGEDYDKYYELYNGDDNLLAREAAAKLVAQNLAERAGIDESVSFISNKWLNYIANIFKNGSETEVKAMVDNFETTVKNIVDSIYDQTFIDYFDPNNLTSSTEMYQVESKVRDIKAVTEDALQKLAKRVKILNLRRVNGKLSREDSKAYNDLDTAIEKEKYASGICSFLGYALDDIKRLQERMLTQQNMFSMKESLDGKDIKFTFTALRDIEIAIQAYEPILNELAAISNNPVIYNELPQEDTDKIESSAKEVRDILNSTRDAYKRFRTTALVQFYQVYWGQDKMINGKLVTLNDVMESTVGDTNWVGRVVNSMSNMPDPLLQLVDIAYKDGVRARDTKVYELSQRLAQLQRELVKATGSRDTSFMYIYRDGKPTGYIKSNIDYHAYFEAMNAYRAKLKEKGYTDEQISAKMHSWRNRNTELYNGQRLPKQSLYPSNALDSLTKPQREYYDAVMKIKDELDAMLPKTRASRYKAVQKKISGKEAILTKGNFKSAIKKIKDSYVASIDDTEFGEEAMDKGQYVLLDFSGKEVKKVPVYYTTMLDDMSLLDTNFTDSLLSYGAMAYNYSTMMSIADIMEVTASQMNDRKIMQTAGQKKMYERFKIGDKAFEGDYYKLGANSELANKLRNYIDANIYGRRKEKEVWHIGGKEINAGKIGDSLIRYNSLVGMGYNLFSGMTNVSMGIAQTMIHAVGHKNFGLKDVAKAHLWYNKDLAGAIADQYKDTKTNKLGLLLDRFDALEEFYDNLESSSYYGGVFKKMVGKHNPLIFNSMGEHYLHAIGMLSILNNQKVKVNGKQTALYNALVVKPVKLKDGTTINKIVIADGTTKLDGSEFTEDDLQQIKLLIQDSNHRMHGAFNQTDIGDMNRNAVGRLIKQYRQWMPAFFMDRFKSKRLNVVTGQEEEGFYISAAKTILGFLGDFAHLKFNVATRWSNLTKEEKSNLRMALFEVSLLYLIVGMLKFMGGPDKDDPWLANAFKYNLYRLKMELGAAAPTSTDFLNNWKTLINSPVPAMENIDRVINLLDLSTLGEEVQSGRYKGWNRWLRNAYFAAPYTRNIGRFVDLVNGETSIFTPYIKK